MGFNYQSMVKLLFNSLMPIDEYQRPETGVWLWLIACLEPNTGSLSTLGTSFNEIWIQKQFSIQDNYMHVAKINA